MNVIFLKKFKELKIKMGKAEMVAAEWLFKRPPALLTVTL
jgi:hypothetical protein